MPVHPKQESPARTCEETLCTALVQDPAHSASHAGPYGSPYVNKAPQMFPEQYQPRQIQPGQYQPGQGFQSQAHWDYPQGYAHEDQFEDYAQEQPQGYQGVSLEGYTQEQSQDYAQEQPERYQGCSEEGYTEEQSQGYAQEQSQGYQGYAEEALHMQGLEEQDPQTYPMQQQPRQRSRCTPSFHPHV